MKKTPGLSVEQIDNDSILMRAYGNNTEILIDRDREAKSHALLAERNLATPLLARFNNGLLYKFIRGQVCTPQDLIREPVWRAVAKNLAQWHARLPVDAQPDNPSQTNVVGGSSSDDSDSHGSSTCGSRFYGVIAHRLPTPNIWGVMQKWVLALPTNTDAERKRQILLNKELERSFQELDSTTGLGKSGLVFGHCDLLSANIIMLPKVQGASTTPSASAESVSFIDYEYATPCPAAFDIANHFAEWGGYDCDYDMLPTRDVRREFLQEYLHAYSTYSRSDVEVLAQLNSLAQDVDRYRGMPGLYWGIWALIQATISRIDFDYASYAEVRLGEYWAWREETDGIRHREGKEMTLRERRWAQEF